MRNKLLEFYKENVSVEALVNSRIKRVYRFFSISFGVFIMSIASLLITCLMFIFGFPQPLVISIVAIILSTISLIVSLNMYLRRARAVIRVDLKLPLQEKTGRCLN